MGTLVVPQTDDPNLRVFLQQLAEQVQVSGGTRGDPLDSAITWRELVEKGVVNFDRFAGVKAVGTYEPVNLQLIPMETPQGVHADATMNTFYVTYDITNTFAWSHVEIHGYKKVDKDDPTLSLIHI